MTDHPTRDAGYVRVSTAQQARDGLSLDEQVRKVEQRSADEGWEHVATFVEAGVSGRKDDRPELAKVLALAEAGGIDVLVIPKLDRLGRSTQHLLTTIERLEAAGVRLVSLGDQIDTSTPSGRLLLRMLASIAEFESDMNGERVAGVSDARARQGKWHGPAPYGYRNENSQLVIVLEQAVVVVRIYREYVLEGRSQRAIARGLNQDGFRGPRGGEWEQAVLSKILSTPVYVGRVRVNGEEYHGLHEPILDEDLWRKAQQLRASNRRSDGGSGRKGKAPVANHLLAGGLLQCWCGSPMGAVTKPTRTPGVLYERYVCTSKRRHGDGRCDQPPVKRQAIDEAIWRFVTDTAIDLPATRRLLTDQTDAKLAELDVHRQHAATDAARTQTRLTRVKGDYQDGQLSAAEWRELTDELTTDLDAATALLHQLDAQQQRLAGDAAQTDAEDRVVAELAAMRASIMGEARDGASTGVEAFRTALRRLFVGFVLVPAGRWPTTSLNGVGWPQDDEHRELDLDGYSLWPYVRADAFDLDAFAPRKVAFGLSPSNGSTMAGIQRASISLSEWNAIGLLT